MSELHVTKNALEDLAAQLRAELSVMRDTLDMVNAPQCGDPFMPENITRVQLLAEQRDESLEIARARTLERNAAMESFEGRGHTIESQGKKNKRLQDIISHAFEFAEINGRDDKYTSTLLAILSLPEKK